MLSRKTTKSRDGYTGGTGGVNVSQQKQQNNLHRSSNLISKEKLLHKTENKSRNNERRNPYQQQKYHASSVNPTKSTEREAKHLKTALRRCGDWTEHMSSSKKHYYFDIRTSASQWEKPKDWNDSRAVDVNHQRKPQTKALSSSKPARSERTNHDQTHSASKVNRSLSTSSSSNQTASSGNQQSTTTERSNSNHRLSLSGRVPSHDTSSHNSSSDYNADKDFRSPRNLKDLSGDRDYRLKAMHPGHQRAGTDVDLRGDLYASGQVTPTKNNNSNYHTPGHTPVRVSAPGDKDYRQATPTRPTLTYDATQSGSNGQSLSGFRTLSESSGGDSSAMEKPETGQFYDYSNWNGIRPPPKNNVDVLKQQLSRKGSPHSLDNNLSQHSNDRGMYTSWSGDQNNSSSSRASPATGDFQRHHTAGEITAEVARTITTVLSQAAAASSNNHDHSSSGSNDKLENALQLVLNAVVANKQMKQENDESIDDAADDVAGAKRSRLSTLDDANTTPLHDENNEQQQQQQTTTKPEHPQAVEATATAPVEEAAAVNVLSVFTTFHSCRHLVDQSLMQHIASWPSLQHEREAHRLTTECNRCQMALDDIDFDIAQTRSKVREFEIARMLNEQRVHYLRQEMKEISGQSQTPVHTPTNMSSPYSGGNAVISGMSDPYQQLNTTTANNGSMSERGFVDKFPTTTTPSAVPVRPSS